MPLYPVNIRRCQHIKVNGTQCGSPALRDEPGCFYHMRWSRKNMQVDLTVREQGIMMLPILEDANSVQVGLVEVMRLLATRQIDHRTAALMLYALQTAASNLKRMSLEPETPTHVVIDRKCVEQRPLGASAWSMVEGREYDDITQETDGAKADAALKRLIGLVLSHRAAEKIRNGENGEAIATAEAV